MSASQLCDLVNWFRRIHRKSDISCSEAINRFARWSWLPETFLTPNQSRKQTRFPAPSAMEVNKFLLRSCIFDELEITFKLYVVFIIPRRSLLFPSGVGLINIIVALSIFAVKSPFDSEIACQAKLRSKYSFLADSVCVKVVERINQYFVTLCVTGNRENQVGGGGQNDRGNIDTCQTKVTKCWVETQ